MNNFYVNYSSLYCNKFSNKITTTIIPTGNFELVKFCIIINIYK